jgi:S1-C subfamily serine protease
VLADPRQERESQVRAGELNEHLEGALLGSIASDHPLAGRIEGVQVLAMQRNSSIWSAGLRPGDIIVSINQRPIKTLGDVTQALQEEPDRLLLNIRRGDSAMFLLLK